MCDIQISKFINLIGLPSIPHFTHEFDYVVYYVCQLKVHEYKQFYFTLDIQWVSDLMPNEQFFSHIMSRTSYSQWTDDDVHFVPDQHA